MRYRRHTSRFAPRRMRLVRLRTRPPARCEDRRVTAAAPDEPIRLLVVEDDHELADMLVTLFTRQRYEVDLARDGQRALHLGLTRAYRAMVIDRGLPGIDGLDLIARLRRQAVTAPVLVLTALGDVADRVGGLDAGADDYLVKPFEIDELLARVRALCRRHLDAATLIPLGAGRLDLELHEVQLPDRRTVRLSAREFELLQELAALQRMIHSRSDLRLRIFDDAPSESIVDTYVYYLRRKLGRDVVRTVRGLGYQVGAL